MVLRVESVFAVGETLDSVIHVVHLSHVLLDPVQVHAETLRVAHWNVVGLEAKRGEVVTRLVEEEVIVI